MAVGWRSGGEYELVAGVGQYTDVAATFLPPQFTIADVRSIYEAIWGISLDPGNSSAR